MDLAGKTVFITGAGGFIGSHLVERCVEEGCRVRALVRYNSANRWGWLDSLGSAALKRIEVVVGDVRDGNVVREASQGVDVTFHLAALIGIPYSYHAPDSYVATNIGGTLNVLQAARDHGVSRVLITSTSEVYGTAQKVPIEESHPRQPQSPYSATKIAADCMAESFWRSFDLPVTIVRPFNTYGPRQSARAVIPTIISQLLNPRSELTQLKLGSLHPTRDLVFVKDTAAGFIELARCDAAVGQEVNIATGSETSVRDLADKLIALLGRKAEVLSEGARVRPERSEVERLLGSTKRLHSLTRWRPGTTIDQGLEQTVAWFRQPENLRLYKAGIYNV